MTDKAITESDRIESRLYDQLTTIYMAVYAAILARFKHVFDRIEAIDSGEVKPPHHARGDPDAFYAWRKRYIRHLFRQENMAAEIGEMLAAIGPVATMYIRKAMQDIYRQNWQYVADTLASGATITSEQVEKASSEAEDEFTTIAYENLANPMVPEKRANTELVLVLLLGLSAAELKRRLHRISERSLYQAVRISATQRTTVQSVARMAAGQQYGHNLGYRWRTVGDNNVRHTHKAMDGQIRYGNEPFDSPSGARLRFPGDPTAPPGERINCRCWLETY